MLTPKTRLQHEVSAAANQFHRQLAKLELESGEWQQLVRFTTTRSRSQLQHSLAARWSTNSRINRRVPWHQLDWCNSRSKRQERRISSLDFTAGRFRRREHIEQRRVWDIQRQDREGSSFCPVAQFKVKQT